MTERAIDTTPPAPPLKVYVKFEVPEHQPELFKWWMATAEADFNQGAPKADEYGAHDLEIMGVVLFVLATKRHIADAFKRIQSPGDSGYMGMPVHTELACWFYVLGKVARLVSDYVAERPGKADTWHDITFYSMMARRIQETGQWP